MDKCLIILSAVVGTLFAFVPCEIIFGGFDMHMGKVVRKAVGFLAFLWVMMPAFASAGVIADSHFNSLSEGGWECHGYAAAPQIAQISSSPDPSNALKINFPDGFRDGYNPSSCSTTASYNTDEVYRQLYVYFPAGYEFHPVANKLAYDYLKPVNDQNAGNFFIAVRDDMRVSIELQPEAPIYTNRVLYPNVKNVYLQTNTWYKITWYVKLNTSGSSNGIAKVWVNDVLTAQYTDIQLRAGTFGSSPFYHATILPIWGGIENIYKDGADYFYVDRAIVSTEPISGTSGGGTVPATKEPNPPANIVVR